MKPRILVTSAAGHTGAATTATLLEQGFPVRAFVRRFDSRAERLRRAGAEVVAGNLLDIRDLRDALVGVQRAYYCAPFGPNTLHGSLLFALAAEEVGLEAVAALTAWNPHPTHPSIHQREHWIANNIHRWMPNVPVIHINPGVFAFTYFFGLPAAVHFGQLMLPFGNGLNAPPSNEDIAAVVAGVLADPTPHIGRSYRPTGPTLISGDDAADAVGEALGRSVRYRNVPIRLFTKAAKTQGLRPFEIAQIRHYAEEIQGGTYAIGAPTDHVEQVTGRPAEPFEDTARRYIANPQQVMPGFAVGTRIGALTLLLKTLLTRAPNLDRWESERGYPLLDDAVLAHDSPEWRASASEQRLPLLTPKPAAFAAR